MIKCGVAIRNITPSAELMPNLYGLMGGKFVAVIDELHLRVLALGNETGTILIVSAELDKALGHDEVVAELAKRQGIPEQNIIYFGIHTHTAPLFGERLHEGPNGRAKKTPEEQEATLKFEDFVKNLIYDAADEAVKSMQPARLGWSSVNCYVGENRCQDYFVETEEGIKKYVSLGSNPEGVADPTLFVLKAETLDGKPICFFINHAVHCCIMFLNNYDGKGGIGISADLAGAVSTLVENKFPGTIAFWSSGAAGDINPRMMNQYIYADENTGAPTEFRDVKYPETASLMLRMLSHRQFADVLRAIRNINCDITDGTFKGIEKMVSCESKTDEPYEVRLRAVKAANLVLCGASGELYGSLGKILKDAGVDVVINHEGSLEINSGYIFDDATIERLEAGGDLPGSRGLRMVKGAFTAALTKAGAELVKEINM